MVLRIRGPRDERAKKAGVPLLRSLRSLVLRTPFLSLGPLIQGTLVVARETLVTIVTRQVIDISAVWIRGETDFGI